MKEDLYQLGLKAFNEDRMMIEAQQRNIDLAPGTKMVKLSVDSGIAHFYRVMNELLRAEVSPGADTIAAESAEGAGE